MFTLWIWFGLNGTASGLVIPEQPGPLVPSQTSYVTLTLITLSATGTGFWPLTCRMSRGGCPVAAAGTSMKYVIAHIRLATVVPPPMMYLMFPLAAPVWFIFSGSAFAKLIVVFAPEGVMPVISPTA